MKYSILALLLIFSACQSDKKEDNSIYLDLRGADTVPTPPFLSDPDIQRVLNYMQHRRDSMRRFNEIHLKCDSFWTLHSLANGDSAWAFYYVDSVNYYWHIVQKERAAQEKKIVRLKQ